MHKIGLIILFLTALSVNAQKFESNNTVTLSFSGSLTKCIDSIESQTGLHFNYKLQNLNNKNISLECENEPLLKILKIIRAGDIRIINDRKIWYKKNIFIFEFVFHKNFYIIQNF